jgi:hypothetical protein
MNTPSEEINSSTGLTERESRGSSVFRVRKGMETHLNVFTACSHHKACSYKTTVMNAHMFTFIFMFMLKVISGGTLVDTLLSEFPGLTRPTGVQWGVCHNTVHHIRTTPGPLVTCRTCRPAPDRLTVAKVEFEAMVRDGTARPSESSWSSELHIVPKKGNGWCHCCDYRALNTRTIPDRYPVRHIHDYPHTLTSYVVVVSSLR